jgi:hypothetical protein
MTEPQPLKKETGKGGLIALGVLVVILAISNIIVYMSMQNQITALNKAQLNAINVKWTDNHPWFSTPYIVVSGTVFNSGIISASSAYVTINIYSSTGSLLKSQAVLLGTIAGKNYQNFEETISYTGDADYTTTTLTYT